MKRIIYPAVSAFLSAVPLVSFAATTGFNSNGGKFGTLLKDILTFSNTVLIPFIIGIGFLVFVYGMFMYFVVGGADEAKQKQGKSLMIYATLGFVLIVVFWGVVNLLASSTGLGGDTIDPSSIKNVSL